MTHGIHHITEHTPEITDNPSTGAPLTSRVSVIIPAYNAQMTIVDAVSSAQAQTYKNLEIIVVDDCSTDKTQEILNTLKFDKRLKVLKHNTNRGVAAARNTGIETASGSYIAFLDADDIWFPEKISTQLSKMISENADVCHSSYIRWNPEIGTEQVVHCKPRVTFSQMLKTNEIGNLTGLYNASKLGRILQKPIGHEDYLMWLKIIEKSGFSIGVTQPLAKYRITSGSLSSSTLRSAKWHFQILRNELRFSLIKSSVFFIQYAYQALKKRVAK